MREGHRIAISVFIIWVALPLGICYGIPYVKGLL